MKHLFNELREDKRLVFILAGILLASIVAAGLMITVSIGAKHLQYKNELNYGYASMSAQDYEEAIEAFENAYLTDATDEAAIGLAKAWYASGNTEKAIQVVTSRMELYESTEELNTLLEEYKEAIGYYSTVVIGGKTINKTDTTILLKDVTLTEADKLALSEFSELVTLSLINCGLTDINFLSDCSKLMSVTLTGNPISDFTPLQDKPDLRTLYIDNTAIADFDQLHSFTNLSTLNASGNWITVSQRDALTAALPGCAVYTSHEMLIETITLGGVSFNTDVTELDLSGLGLVDTSVLTKCTRLERLDLSDNKIGWITGLGEIPTLKWLDLSGNRLSNISALDTLTELTYLDLTGNSITNITPLAPMTKLTELYLGGNPIYHGHANLSVLVNLKKLNLNDTLMQDKYLSHIAMDNMTELDLRSNPQLKAEALQSFASSHSGCTVLHDHVIADIPLGSKSFKADTTNVDASYSSVIDLSAVAGFTNLTALNLAGNGISDFSPLKSLTTLTELDLSATGMADPGVLADINTLQKLDLSGNSLKDVYALSSCTGLTELKLTDNSAINDLSPLTYCTNLTALHIDGTAVSDLTPLSKLPALNTLYLDRCPITDFTQLHSLTELKTLYIIDCGISPTQLYELQQALPACSIYAGDVTATAPTPEVTTETSMVDSAQE